MQYLSARFQKGQKWVAELMEKQHRYMNLRSHSGGLSDAHAELLRYQAAAGDGGNASLDINLKHTYYFGATQCSSNDVCFGLIRINSHRLTIMILDLSVWPSRALAFFTTICHSEPDVAFKL